MNNPNIETYIFDEKTNSGKIIYKNGNTQSVKYNDMKDNDFDWHVKIIRY